MSQPNPVADPTRLALVRRSSYKLLQLLAQLIVLLCPRRPDH